MVTDRYAELRAALNLDLPPLPWHAPGLAELYDANGVCVAYFSDCDPVDEERRPVPTIKEGDRFARYVAATNKETIRSLLANCDRLRAALALAYTAMNYMGDILNEMDAVEEEDEEATAPAFEAVRAALAQEQGESNDK